MVAFIAATTLAAVMGSAGQLAHPAHVTVVIMENHGYFEIIGDRRAPYVNRLASRGALMTSSYAVTHPSLPNYLALFSGDTWGVRKDTCPLTLNQPSIAGELLAAHKTFKTYAESIPSDGWTGCASGDGLYARKHVPSTYFADTPATLTVSYAHLRSDLSTKRYPNLALVIPNMCDDTHDCDVATGDKWLRANLPPILNFDRAHNGLLILTWDEDDGSAANHIVTLLIGPMVKPGSYDQRIDHLNILRTIADLERVRPPAASAAAAPIRGIFH
jgi:acid phosphatase